MPLGPATLCNARLSPYANAMSHAALRFFVAALLSALAAIVVATLSLLLFTAFGSEAINGGFDGGAQAGIGATIMATLGILIFAIPIGGLLALPTALVMGGAMVWLTMRAPQLDRVWAWAIAAILGAVPSMFFVGTSYSVYPDRAILALWLMFSSVLGALVFRWWWRRSAP